MVWYSPWLAMEPGTPFQAGDADVIQFSITSQPPRLTPLIGVTPFLIFSLRSLSELQFNNEKYSILLNASESRDAIRL